MTDQKLIATLARRNISYGLVVFAVLALIFSFTLFMQGIGGTSTDGYIQILDIKIAPGTVGASFLAVAGGSIWAITKTMPKIQKG